MTDWKHGPHFTQAAIDQVRRLHSRGLTDRQIAESMDIARSSVCDIRFKRLNLRPNGQKTNTGEIHAPMSPTGKYRPGYLISEDEITDLYDDRMYG